MRANSLFFWRITALDRIFLWKTHNSLRPLAPNSTAISMVFAIHKSFKTFQITETHLFSQWLKEKRLLLKRGTRTQRKAISWLLSWWGFISSCRKVSHSAASHAFLFLLFFFLYELWYLPDKITRSQLKSTFCLYHPVTGVFWLDKLRLEIHVFFLFLKNVWNNSVKNWCV